MLIASPRPARIALLLAGAFAALGVAAARADELYHEHWRPQFHFTPPAQWMNDPNGMVYFDGEYHLFYQYHPFSTRWGPMHWGHAVSRDLLHWQHLPIALYPDRHGAIFSGSAVFDRDNTSGLGTRERPPLVAVFAYHDHQLEKQGAIDIESQGIAYSLDRGRTWAKFGGNPVLKNPGLRDFRDPKVFWYAPRGRWIMTLAAGDHVSFYSSRDLKVWAHEGDFGQGMGSHAGVWECPDLVEMEILGEREHRFVLLVSVNPGAPNGGSGTQYFVGRFDGRRFTPDEPSPPSAQWLDYGTDDYAGVTWSGGPLGDRRHLFLGWMSNWNYAQDVPTERWRSAMTLPRELKLVKADRALRLRAVPVAETRTLRGRGRTLAATRVTREMELLDATEPKSAPLELALAVRPLNAQLISLTFRNPRGEETVFKINRADHRIELDRSRSGVVEFSPSFGALQTAPMITDGDSVSLRVFLDHSSLEIFVNEGETVFSALVFPRSPYDSIVLEADEDIELSSGAVYALKSIWEGKP